MLKKLGVPVIALAAMLTLFTPHAANAKGHWRFGVSVGAPVYGYPYYSYPYYAPYDPYYYGPYYGYTPYYSPDPYSTFGYYGGWGHHERHERLEHRGFENRGNRGVTHVRGGEHGHRH